MTFDCKNCQHKVYGDCPCTSPGTCDFTEKKAAAEVDNDKLKPCPFCGGIAERVEAKNTHAGVDMIVCCKCSCRMYSTSAEKWNTRFEATKCK